MKALITAFALLSFVAASTIPLATEAQAKTAHHVKGKKHVHKVAHKKHNTGKRMKKPSQA
jgi:Ni/Co efflux regulator RcnB